ncbi:MAG: hypothetical protein RSD14_05360 [Clostridia bacterium]
MKKDTKIEAKVVVASTILTTAVVSGFTLSQGPNVLAKESYKRVQQEVVIKDVKNSSEKVEVEKEIKDEIKISDEEIIEEKESQEYSKAVQKK